MNNLKRQPYEDLSIIKTNKFQVYKQKKITGYRISNKTRINIGLYLLFREDGNNSETSKDLNRPRDSIQWVRYWAVDIIITIRLFIIIIFLNVVLFLFEGTSFDVVSDIHADKMVTFNYGYTGKP